MTTASSEDPTQPFAKRPTGPSARWVNIPSFNGPIPAETQAIRSILKHRPEQWKEVMEAHDTRLANAARERDYYDLIQIVGPQDPYLLICWIVLLSSQKGLELVPPQSAC